MGTIKLKNKECVECGRDNQPHFSKGRCKDCAQKSYNKPKQNSSINKVSEKRKQEQKSYSVLRKLFLEANPECACGGKIPGCDGMATDIHHARGRTGSLYLDVRHFKGLTRSCHAFVELNPLKAKEMGLSGNRLA